MHLAFLSEFDPDRADRDDWPHTKLGHWGHCVTMADALEAAGHRVTRVGGLNKTREHGSLRAKVRRRFAGLRDRHHLAWVEPRFNIDYARQFEAQLAAKLALGDRYDAIVTPDPNLISHLKTDLPLFFWADTAYATLLDEYPGFRDLTARSRRNLLDLDRRAMQRCGKIFLASDWAIAGAMAVHGWPRDRFECIELGANFEPDDPATVEPTIAARDRDTCRLLFVGTDWQRKGGDRAVALVDELRDRLVPASLAVVGATPELSDPNVKIVGRLDLAKAADRDRLEAEFRAAHFLVLPSDAECFGHVLCEANAFGVPVLTTDAGGMPTVVRAGVNGFTHGFDGWAAAMADRVTRLWRDRAAYENLARSSRTEYDARLNWTVLGRRIGEAIERCLP
ncbi:MAG: glycosyltransferase family 4 protein [Geitlerinemataceae cyanobacterium]